MDVATNDFEYLKDAGESFHLEIILCSVGKYGYLDLR